MTFGFPNLNMVELIVTILISITLHGLIDHCKTLAWKEGIVRAITDGDQVDCILNISLAKSKKTDIIVWKSWLDETFRVANEKSKKLLAITLWAVWLVRNRLVHDPVRKTVDELVAFIFSYLREIDEISPIRVITVPTLQQIWRPPDPDAFIAEARACEQAIRFAIDMGFRKVQMEGDSLTFIKRLNSYIKEKSILSLIVGDIKDYLSNILGRRGANDGRNGSRGGLDALGLVILLAKFSLYGYGVLLFPR
ncbi:hypothetical protein J1N35_038499 [Gossypium stocksii]|uniref:RNase H type-1 domain-containing protein n=1 Tax=Gossypium stocksii TaxID=47602 RepID=A0A9D3UML0_9ROSI|nr:hypothetical protein J1N35_038499 [Gossypium stocksii]